MVKHNRTNVNIPMCLAAILLCLTLLSLHWTSGLYARYSTSEAGSDSARVIRFGDLTLTEEGDFYEGKNLMILPGVDLQKKAMVSFDGSESATYVFVEVAPTKWETADHKAFSILSNDEAVMQWQIAEGWTFLEADGGTYVYYRELAPNTELDRVDILAEEGKITVSGAITRKDIQNLTGVSIKLRASVVQSGGFENPAEAWKSIMEKEGSAIE